MLADDSITLTVVIPKALKHRCVEIAKRGKCSVSDSVRKCIVEGASVIERKLDREG